ncbi:hypothetical protein F5B22DRAFT_659227 [Xylaria bambusicola]|uniref:uncharacterized protein n=1 Tax=Xylaria bambusicola TaxID=326684 RepID=UPI0020082EF1|nr:uncharacterized protein F5B22DRAFT_659227 [Xylaria bambusicola]KAI0508460.1 hypothetical protein F5B22DRAFT_659227 [Xylaria bambusicola]
MADIQEEKIVVKVFEGAPVLGFGDCVDDDKNLQSTMAGSDRDGTNTPGSAYDTEVIAFPLERRNPQSHLKECEMNGNAEVAFIDPGTAHNATQVPNPIKPPITEVTFADNAPTGCCYYAIKKNYTSSEDYLTIASIGDGNVDDDMSVLPELSAEDFKTLNRSLFNYDPQNGYSTDERLVYLFVGSYGVRLHERVLVHCKFLQDVFKSPAKPSYTLTDQTAFQDVGIQEVKILMQAIYGIQSPVLGHANYQGADYMEALWLSEMLHCDAGVYDSITLCARAHFSAFKYWQTIPANSMTQDFHRAKLAEINVAFKVYRSRAPGNIPRAFRDNSFAILLAKFCPDFVYCLYSDMLDYDLAHQVGVAAIRMRDRIAPFSTEEMKLFTSPSL